MKKMETNPIMQMDFPDPDVIRVEDTYYMVSTTMHFMPGGVILRSYDLINWEIATHIYDVLDSTPGQCLSDEKGIYGKGMWAATIRYHKGTFYVCFAANDTRKTYLYKSDKIEGKWEKHYIEGFYHDCSLLFDDDDRVYIVYGNTEIHLTELDESLRGPKEGGIDRIIIRECGKFTLGYEGAHFYKIHGKYYVFLIHSPGDEWFRTEACFMAETLEGEFTGRDVLRDDLEYCNQGVAQGGIVDTPDGEWYGILFQDRGAVGRIPILVPLRWEDEFPVFGKMGKVPKTVNVKSTRPDYQYKPLAADDDFRYLPDEKGNIHLKEVWEFNHEPVSRLWSVNGREGEFRIQSGKISQKLEDAVNTLTQRTRFPKCEAMVTVNGRELNTGDYAGICILQGCFGFAAIKREEDGNYLAMAGREAEDTSLNVREEWNEGKEYERIRLHSDVIRLKIVADFQQMKDEAAFFYEDKGTWKQIGITQKLYFKMDHFTGSRIGLFMYSTEKIGGVAGFSDFRYL